MLFCSSSTATQLEFLVSWLAEILDASLAVARGWNLYKRTDLGDSGDSVGRGAALSEKWEVLDLVLPGELGDWTWTPNEPVSWNGGHMDVGWGDGQGPFPISLLERA